MTGRDDVPLAKKSLVERLLAAHARDQGTTAARVRRWVTTMTLLGALDRVRAADDTHHFIVKGGVAMELRLGLRARTTQDVDLTFHGAPDELDRSLATAFALPYAGFTFTVGESVPIGATGAHRFVVRVQYAGKGWATTSVEIAITPDPPGEVDLVPAISLQDFRLDGPERVATLLVRYQMAQKLHAVTERFESGENTRVRDVLDLLLLSEIAPAPELSRVRDACVEVFIQRDTHPWPPELIVYDSWPATYERLAREIDFPITNVRTAADVLRELIASIDASI